MSGSSLISLARSRGRDSGTAPGGGAKSQVRHGDGDDWMNFEKVLLGLAISTFQEFTYSLPASAPTRRKQKILSDLKHYHPKLTYGPCFKTPCKRSFHPKPKMQRKVILDEGGWEVGTHYVFMFVRVAKGTCASLTLVYRQSTLTSYISTMSNFYLTLEMSSGSLLIRYDSRHLDVNVGRRSASNNLN